MDLERTKAIAEEIKRRHPDWGQMTFIRAGNSGAVFRLEEPRHGPVALKVYDPAFFSGPNALIEAQRVKLQEALRSHGNKHLIDVIEAVEIPDLSTWYILMELCPWETLDVLLTQVPDDQVQSLLSQLVDAVLFLDSRHLVHRDIKPANIAVSPEFSDLKLLDLGVLRRIGPEEGNGTDAQEKTRFIATAQYSPPEYLTREEAGGESGFGALNIYQVGAVLHDLIMRKPIFAEEAATLNRYILYKAITTKRPLIVNPKLPARLITLCKASLEKSPHERLAKVKLEDFRQELDSIEALRRRLGPISKNTTASCNPPSTWIWERPVRDWVTSAARREKDTLGPFTMKRVEGINFPAWDLSFSANRRYIRVDLCTSTDGNYLEVFFSIDRPSVVRISVLEIFDGDPLLQREEAISSLAQHILYMLDLAETQSDISAQGSQP
jgi:serine/threonine protein kinase